jgi:hypothetical protein
VWEYQAIQTGPDAVTFLVVPTRQFSSDFRVTLERRLEEFLGPDMTVTVTPVPTIPVEPSGKRLIIKTLTDAIAGVSEQRTQV